MFSYRPTQTISVFIYRMSYSVIKYIDAGRYIALVELLGLLLREYTTADYVPMPNVGFTTTW